MRSVLLAAFLAALLLCLIADASAGPQVGLQRFSRRCGRNIADGSRWWFGGADPEGEAAAWLSATPPTVLSRPAHFYVVCRKAEGSTVWLMGSAGSHAQSHAWLRIVDGREQCGLSHDSPVHHSLNGLRQ